MSTISKPFLPTWCLVLNIHNSIVYHAWTLFLFTKSDIKTIVIPVTLFAVASAPLASLSRLLPSILWVWLQLLQANVSNQTIDVEEDKRNKSWRPLPTDRISLRNALIFRWVLPLICCTWSISYSTEVFYASAVNCTLTLCYNELHLADRHWATRNIMNALGYASFEAGACLIAGESTHSLDIATWQSILCSTGIIATTVHAQDFKDVMGDRVIGRHTLAIEHPDLSRQTLLVILVSWSLTLSSLWGVSSVLTHAYSLLGIFIGWRFISKKNVKSDERSYYLYNVWLSLAHVLPAYSKSLCYIDLYACLERVEETHMSHMITTKI